MQRDVDPKKCAVIELSVRGSDHHLSHIASSSLYVSYISSSQDMDTSFWLRNLINPKC